jgi:hypothetical protein
MSEEQSPQPLNDYDVLGIGGLRQAELLADPRPRILKIHPDLIPERSREIYNHILADTLRWLHPREVLKERLVGDPDEIIFQLLKQEFAKQFPKMVMKLPNFETPLRAYVEEFPWQGPLLADHFRYWPQFLKTHGSDPSLQLLAQQEWLWSYVSFTDFGAVKIEPGLVQVNPSLQTLRGLESLRVIFYDELRNRVVESDLDISQAAILDTLQEDRKYSLDQLLGQLLLQNDPAAFSWVELEKTLEKMIHQGTILVSAMK